MSGKLQTVTVERLAYGGDGIAHRDDGKTVFIAGACPGDVLLIRTNSEKKGFCRARIVNIEEASPNRQKPHCPNADVCGGCPWQHIAYDFQLAAKRANVVDSLVRIGHFPPDTIADITNETIPSHDTWGYRNKVEFDVSDRNGLRLGLHEEHGDFFEVDSCPLLPERYQGAARSLGGTLRFLQGKGDLGLKRVGIRASQRTRDVEIALWTKPGSFPRAQASKVFQDAFPKASLTRVLLKGDVQERVVSNVETLSGKGYWTERVAGNRMHLSAPSFFQVNTAGAELLIDVVMDALDIDSSSTVLDLYCGAGTFTIPLAQRVDKVIAVERQGSSIRDLRRNVEESGLDVDCIGGDVAMCLPDIDEGELAVIDPPQTGLTVKAMDALRSKRFERLVYVSCNPTTLARDLNYLVGQDYRFVSVQPVDLFPQTYHVETVVLMSGVRNRGVQKPLK